MAGIVMKKKKVVKINLIDPSLQEKYKECNFILEGLITDLGLSNEFIPSIASLIFTFYRNNTGLRVQEKDLVAILSHYFLDQKLSYFSLNVIAETLGIPIERLRKRKQQVLKAIGVSLGTF